MTVLENPIATPTAFEPTSWAFAAGTAMSTSATQASVWTRTPQVHVKTSERPGWLRRVVEALVATSSPQDLGDGRQAVGASDELLRSAVEILARITHASSPGPNVVYTPERSIIYSWHKGGWDVEVEISGAGSEAWAYERNSGKEMTGTVDDFEIDLREFITSLGREA